MWGAFDYGGAPVGSIDNGDGTYTFHFNDGRSPITAAGPIAQQYHTTLTPQDPSRPSSSPQSNPGLAGAVSSMQGLASAFAQPPPQPPIPIAAAGGAMGGLQANE